MREQRGKCVVCGNRTRHKINDKFLCVSCEENMSLEDKLTERQEKILGFLDKSSLTENEIKSLLTSRSKPCNGRIEKVNKVKVTYGIISDSHIGSIYYDSKLMDRAAAEFNKRKVDFVCHGGDILEGGYEIKRPGSIYELNEVGGDAQIKRAVKELQKIDKKIPIYAITGNHCSNTFFKMMGFDIGERLSELLSNFKYLGQQFGVIELPYNRKILMLHPDGGSSYSISYRAQKISESLSSGEKPEVLQISHFHKLEYLFYRNIHVLQTGCLQSQSSFMRNRHLSAHKGFTIVTLEVSKNGIERFVPEFFPAYN